MAGTASDAHTWNLVFLELYCGERGHDVVNLGPCVPPELLVDECLRVRPRLVVISTVNGHGLVDGQRAVEALRARPELADTPIVIGGSSPPAPPPTPPPSSTPGRRPCSPTGT
ncbi:cobalamin B12-binding domain-containing protein [Actinokineospora soli]|uniref:Cobalamin B12-binding domain-containing protein n=1 Tax=Actinokineospora soli TaxID=1048753 RepID=A0ABW2TS87_9PSEU